MSRLASFLAAASATAVLSAAALVGLGAGPAGAATQQPGTLHVCADGMGWDAPHCR